MALVKLATLEKCEEEERRNWVRYIYTEILFCEAGEGRGGGKQSNYDM